MIADEQHRSGRNAVHALEADAEVVLADDPEQVADQRHQLRIARAHVIRRHGRRAMPRSQERIFCEPGDQPHGIEQHPAVARRDQALEPRHPLHQLRAERRETLDRRGTHHRSGMKLVEHVRRSFISRATGTTDAPRELMMAPLRPQFLADHEQLEVLLGELIAAFETGDHGIARETFGRFEKLLLEHLEIEERELFPELASTNTAEVADLRDEHRAIRIRLEELAVGVELHQVRLSAIRTLVDNLHYHAAREDRLLYRWAEGVFSEPARRAHLETMLTRGRSPAPPVPR